MQVLGEPNGFDVSESLEHDKRSLVVHNDFRFKPFVALVSDLTERIKARSLERGDVSADGSLRGCDALLPKPLTIDSLSALIDGCSC